VTKSLRNGRSLLAGGKRINAVVAGGLALFCLVARCSGQGTMTVRFEGPPFPGATYPQPPGTTSPISQYSESGMRFWDPSGPQPLVLSGGGMTWAPENGTAYLRVISGGVAFGFNSLALFDLVSLDLAEFSTGLPGPVTVHVVGYRVQDQIAGTVDLTTDGVNDGTGPLADFQTFTFDDRFRNLYRVELSTGGFSLDNVVVGGIPEPSAGGLVLLGALCGLGWRRLRSKQCSWH